MAPSLTVFLSAQHVGCEALFVWLAGLPPSAEDAAEKGAKRGGILPGHQAGPNIVSHRSKLPIAN